MIVKLKGFIEFCSEEYIDLDVNGIVFRVFISNKSIDKIYPSKSSVSIFVYEIIKENESLQVLFLDILGLTQLGEMNALGNKWVYKNNLIDVSVDLTPNDLRYLLEKNRCSNRCNIDATFGNVRVLLKNV